MAYATGTRMAALLFLLISLVPPWGQAIVTLPIWYGLLQRAKNKEHERERELELLEKQHA